VAAQIFSSGGSRRFPRFSNSGSAGATAITEALAVTGSSRSSRRDSVDGNSAVTACFVILWLAALMTPQLRGSGPRYTHHHLCMAATFTGRAAEDMRAAIRDCLQAACDAQLQPAAGGQIWLYRPAVALLFML